MAIQKRHVADLGDVTFQKRKGTRSVRIHIRGGEVKVTLPYWFSYAAAERFLTSRKRWIMTHRTQPNLFVDGTYLGKDHQINVQAGKTLRTRLVEGKLVVTLPNAQDIASADVQDRIRTAAERVLLKESKQHIPSRVQDLALEHNLQHGTITFKKLKSRWGSCDHSGNLVFNIYLVQLPWPLIDYVIVHELAHTVHHNHSKAFWALVEQCLPDYKQRRTQTRQYQPHITVS